MTGVIERMGEAVYALYYELKYIVYLLSESVYWSTIGRFDKMRLPFKGVLSLQMIRLGSSATAIIFLLVFLVGLTLAFQSAMMLETFGAGVFLVRGIAITMFMEIGPLLTAIILAGRSGSAITAEIASMVVQEEVKALRVMGIHPVQYLVLPRFQAMSMATPLLTMLANVAGCFAGYLVATLYIGLPTSLFISELRESLSIVILAKSLFKGLIFGWLIVLVAVSKGLSVRGGADAVGVATTKCVVFSITAIILADAVFSFVFY
ncbi:MAG: ABC transporter permease [Fibromonadales bacterium]|nr:ABC transporter permease [Fibromonadales bacterium]